MMAGHVVVAASYVGCGGQPIASGQAQTDMLAASRVGDEHHVLGR